METPSYVTLVVDFVRAHQAWAAPIAFTLAFLESLAFLSLLVPSTAILIGISGLIGAAGVEFWPVWLAGGTGGVIGYSLSYWLGRHFKEPIFRLWPFSRYPDLVLRSHVFFDRWGTLSVFFGHFVGPVRAVIPVIAGSCGLDRLKFEAANVAAAFLWITFVLAPAYLLAASDTFSRLLAAIGLG